ncbi:MAG: hypothetical protein K1Y02_05000 [Candidatus Hydrogenedentes bacterium]|nr:hypothetical protein [Candidatus Hydrogenedentota bacterium]
MISRISDSQSAYAYRSSVSKKPANAQYSGSFTNSLTQMLNDSELTPDTVEFSGASQLLASQPLILPTAKSVQALSADLASKLGDFFRENGFEKDPPITIKVDDNTGVISVTGDRNDTDRIAELINENKDLAYQVRTLNAISSHAYEMPKHLAFQEEYRDSDNPEDIVSKYSYLFGPQVHRSFSIVYDGSAVQMMVDGKAWGSPVS